MHRCQREQRYLLAQAKNKIEPQIKTTKILRYCIEQRYRSLLESCTSMNPTNLHLNAKLPAHDPPSFDLRYQ